MSPYFLGIVTDFLEIVTVGDHEYSASVVRDVGRVYPMYKVKLTKEENGCRDYWRVGGKQASQYTRGRGSKKMRGRFRNCEWRGSS